MKLVNQPSHIFLFFRVGPYHLEHRIIFKNLQQRYINMPNIVRFSSVIKSDLSTQMLKPRFYSTLFFIQKKKHGPWIHTFLSFHSILFLFLWKFVPNFHQLFWMLFNKKDNVVDFQGLCVCHCIKHISINVYDCILKRSTTHPCDPHIAHLNTSLHISLTVLTFFSMSSLCMEQKAFPFSIISWSIIYVDLICVWKKAAKPLLLLPLCY